MQASRLRRSDGIALLTALYALVIMGALMATTFFLSVLEARLGRATLKLTGAFSAAEAGIGETVGHWNREVFNRLSPGGSAAIPPRWLGTSAWYRGTVRRLNRQLFFIAVEGFSQDSTSRQTLGLLARLNPFPMEWAAALTTRGAVALEGSSSVRGSDEPPTGWTDCPPPVSPRAALRLPPSDSAAIELGGCGNYSCLSGAPKIQTDSTLGSGPLASWGPFQFADLARMASETLPGGSYVVTPRASPDGSCEVDAPDNWGDPVTPDGPCAGYLPMILITGDASITGTVGQGVLIVDGNLTLDGGFEFYGAVVVRKTLSITGTGARLNGAVLAAEADLSPTGIVGGAGIGYSSCAIGRSANATAMAAPLSERSWMTRY